MRARTDTSPIGFNSWIVIDYSRYSMEDLN